MLENVKKLEKGDILSIIFLNSNKNNTNLHLLLSWSGKWLLQFWNLICNLKYNTVVTSFSQLQLVIIIFCLVDFLHHSAQFKTQSCMIQRSYLIWYKQIFFHIHIYSCYCFKFNHMILSDCHFRWPHFYFAK